MSAISKAMDFYLGVASAPQDGAEDFLRAASKPFPLVYADFIADRIRKALQAPESREYIARCSSVQHDLHPTKGYMLSLNKSLIVTDNNGRKYRVTVREIEATCTQNDSKAAPAFQSDVGAIASVGAVQ